MQGAAENQLADTIQYNTIQYNTIAEAAQLACELQKVELQQDAAMIQSTKIKCGRVIQLDTAGLPPFSSSVEASLAKDCSAVCCVLSSP